VTGGQVTEVSNFRVFTVFVSKSETTSSENIVNLRCSSEWTSVPNVFYTFPNVMFLVIVISNTSNPAFAITIPFIC
jgi:hypothetical protein